MNLPHDPLQRLLDELAAGDTVPDSRLSTRARERLTALFDAGVLLTERRGAGRVVRAQNTSAVAALRERLFPGSDTGPVATPRAAAVAALRDAKRAARAEASVVLLRATGPASAWIGGQTLDVPAMTRQLGAVAVVLDAGRALRIESPLAIVENLECFLHAEQLGTGAPLALYAGGRLPGPVLDWLASDAMRRADLIHCGDYDPVGLDEFLRLHAARDGRARLHVPPDLEKLFQRYGKPALLSRNQSLMPRLRACTIPAVSDVVRLMHDHGCGLEQEALLISPREPGSACK